MKQYRSEPMGTTAACGLSMSHGVRKRHALNYARWMTGLLLLAITGTLWAVPVTTVVQTGDIAAGTGIPFYKFFTPVINEVGDVAFQGTLRHPGADSSNDRGIWAGHAGSLAKLVRSGPGIKSMGAPLLSDSGQLAFRSWDSSSRASILSGLPGDLRNVATEGSPAPGTHATYRSSTLGDPLLNAAGQVAFSAGLLDGASLSAGAWTGDPAINISLLAQSGDPAPGTGQNLQGISLNRQEGAINDRGETIFSGTFISPTRGSSGGLWRGSPGGLSKVVTGEDVAPGTSSNFHAYNMWPSINNNGQIAFRADLDPTTNGAGIWFDDSSGLSLVTRVGDTAPGTGGADFAELFWKPLLNAHGELAFLGKLSGTGVDASNDMGIWRYGADRRLSLVVREGDIAPGTGGAFFSGIFREPTINAAGQIAFVADLTGSGIDNSNSFGIWVANPMDDMLEPIIRKGDPLEVAPGDWKTIASLGFSIDGSGNEDGRRSGFNDSGQLAFSATFTNPFGNYYGGGGIFVASTAPLGGAIPEPASWLLLLPGFVLLMMTEAVKRIHVRSASFRGGACFSESPGSLAG